MYPPTDTKKWLKPPDCQSIIDPRLTVQKNNCLALYLKIHRFKPVFKEYLGGIRKKRPYFLNDYHFLQIEISEQYFYQNVYFELKR